MGWIAKLFGAASKEDLRGLELDPSEAWEVSAPKDITVFFRHLDDLLPVGSVLYFEGSSLADEVKEYFDSTKARETKDVAMGTIWPRPLCYHLPAAPDVFESIVDFSATHASPELADHFHVYDSEGMVLQWHDAFYDDPFFVTNRIPTEKLTTFCRQVGSTSEGHNQAQDE